MPPQLKRPLLSRLKLSRSLIGLISIPCVVFLGIGLVNGRREWMASRQLERKLQPLRDAGSPVGDAAMSRRFRDATSDAGTAAWSRINLLCNAFRWQAVDSLPVVGTQELPARIAPDTAWDADKPVGAYLAAIKPILDLIHASAEVPMPVWQPVEFRGVQTLLPHLQESRQVARMLRLESEHALFHREPARAMRAIDSLQATAAAYDWHLFMVGELVHLALYQIYLDSISRSLNVDLWNQEQLDSLLTRLRAELPIEEKWRASLAAEQLMIIATLENNSNWARHAPTPLLPLWSTPTARLELYNTYDELMTLADAGADQLSTRSRQWEESFVRQAASGDSMLQGLFFPAIHPFALALDRASDKRKMTLTAVAIKIYQTKFDRWPEALSELARLGLRDTDWILRTQGPIGYEVAETGVELFCYAPDTSEIQPSTPTVIRREPGVAYTTIPIQ